LDWKTAPRALMDAKNRPGMAFSAYTATKKILPNIQSRHNFSDKSNF
jgi:hypothetical protein